MFGFRILTALLVLREARASSENMAARRLRRLSRREETNGKDNCEETRKEMRSEDVLVISVRDRE